MSDPLGWLSHAAGTALGRRYPFVLCYHGIGDPPEGGDPYGIFMSAELFGRHLEAIEARGYELLSVGSLWRLIADGSGADGKASISFDDALRATVRGAIPALIERGIACSLFVPSGLLGREHPDVAGEPIAEASEIRELADRGVEVGAHSVDHVRLTGIPYGEVLDQMRRSRETLEDLLQRPVTTMAYPFGALDEQAMRAAREAGYEVACGCSGAGPWRALNLPREPVHASATPLRLRLKMAGLYGPVYATARARGALRRRPRARIGS